MKPIGLAILLACASAAQAQEKWKPYQFKGDERYEFKVTGLKHDKGEIKELIYSFEIKNTGADAAEITYSTRVVHAVKKEDVGEQTAFGVFGFFGGVAITMIANPMYAALFNDLELKVGEKLSFFGAMMVRVTGKEKVGDREGFVCKIFGKKDDKEEQVAEWVVDPALAMPIKAVQYEDGKPAHTIELVSYKKF